MLNVLSVLVVIYAKALFDAAIFDILLKISIFSVEGNKTFDELLKKLSSKIHFIFVMQTL